CPQPPRYARHRHCAARESTSVWPTPTTARRSPQLATPTVPTRDASPTARRFVGTSPTTTTRRRPTASPTARDAARFQTGKWRGADSLGTHTFSVVVGLVTKRLACGSLNVAVARASFVFMYRSALMRFASHG